MRVDPALAEFAGDPAWMALAQGRVLAARDAWAAWPDVASVLRECDALAGGRAFQECPQLGRLMAGEGAHGFVANWLNAMMQAWRDNPMAQLSFRHSHAGGTAIMHLYHANRVTLAVMAVAPGVAESLSTIAFTDCERREIVLAGRGRAKTYPFREGATPEAEEQPLERGVQLRRDGGQSGVILAEGAPVVLLRLALDPERPAPTHEVEIASGRVVHRASASAAEGRAELAAALLGAMGRSDAAPTLADYACGQAGEGARWQALRHALALETGAGFAGLCAIADRGSDPLAAPARDLRDRLCATYPQLANLRADACLAS
ncbi:hypothetical protein [Alteriqipengyuania lutimaris]|uniref:Uncharacterized protein n=1 Tax=Alteriqipengyuania lutimaris TaxID=1538146 RepID=A0A395LT83_9SPHN|nr:hypothetical protein [Alteriqipengyuania lutimaris]MBB3033211.1 hypothetical protein [Alteriqipengyuania lutimaris]RDS77740.1 hypothetical protein DL238_09075 [Alteriqipengyuania lutimaris]